MIAPENILVSMTSWKMRIDNVHAVIQSLLHQTLMPTKIILNLCTEDFPNMEEDLPTDLLDVIHDESNCVELYWFIENYKAWKKHLHVLEVASDEDLIISTDDDHLYPEDFIEKMYLSYCYYDKKFPVTLNKTVLTHNMWCFNGPATLYKKEYFGNYKKYLTDGVLHNCMEDHFINILMAINRTIPLPEIFHLPPDSELLYNDDNAWTDKSSRERYHKSQESINELHRSTLQVMEDSLDKFYFKHQETVFNPKFWNIIYDAIEYTYKEYGEKYKPIKFLKKCWETNFLQPNYPVDFASLDLDIPHYSKEHYLGNDKLIISLSSWPGRINNISKIVNDMLYQTMAPDKIIVTLAKEDFDLDLNKNVDLHSLVIAGKFPNELYDIVMNNSKVILNWLDSAKLKSWKKHLGVIPYAQENDVIITIDDDILYKETFIETMVKSFYEYGKSHAISCGREFCQGGFAIYGYALLYTPNFINFRDKTLFPDLIFDKFPEDNHILNVLSFNGHCVLPVIGYNYLFYSLSFNQGDSNFGNGVFNDEWWESYKDLSDASAEILRNAGKDREEIKMNWTPVYFNFTIGNLIKYIKFTNKEVLSEPVQEVYAAVEEYLTDTSKAGELFARLREKIDTVIL